MSGTGAETDIFPMVSQEERTDTPEEGHTGNRV